MKRNICIVTAIISLMLGTSCIHINKNVNSDIIQYSGYDTVIPVDVDDYTRIEANKLFAVVMSDTVKSPYLVIDTALMNHFTINCNKKTLKVKLLANASVSSSFEDTDELDSFNLTGARYPTLYLPFNSKLMHIQTGGAAMFECNVPISMPELEIQAGGASSINVTVDVQKLEGDVSGASNVSLKGKAEQFLARCNGAGHIGGELICKEGDICCSGVSVSEGIECTTKMKAEASGASEITYSGNCSSEEHASGVSTINHI